MDYTSTLTRQTWCTFLLWRSSHT